MALSGKSANLEGVCRYGVLLLVLCFLRALGVLVRGIERRDLGGMGCGGDRRGHGCRVEAESRRAQKSGGRGCAQRAGGEETGEGRVLKSMQPELQHSDGSLGSSARVTCSFCPPISPSLSNLFYLLDLRSYRTQIQGPRLPTSESALGKEPEIVSSLSSLSFSCLFGPAERYLLASNSSTNEPHVGERFNRRVSKRASDEN